MDHAFGTVFKKPFPYSRPQSFLLYIFFCTFNNLEFYIYVFDPFSLNFCIWCKIWIKVNFFFCIRISKCSSIVRLLFFHWSDFALSSKIKYPYTWVYFWILYFAPLTYLSIFMPIPHCREYHSFRISFENGWCWFSNFVFFSKVVLAILDALRFDRYISTKKLAEIWWGLN